MSDFVKIVWKPESLERLGLPPGDYPVPADLVVEVTTSGREVAPEYLLYWMQGYSSTLKEGWEDLEPSMTALAALIAKDEEDRETATVEGDNWFLELGPVELEGDIITVIRGTRILAALSPREDGRLRVAVYAPLDGRSISRLFELARRPHPDHNIICLGYDTNWEYAQGMANRSTAAFYSMAAGSSYLAPWQFGLGINYDKTEDPDYFKQRSLKPMPTAQVALQLGVYYQLADNLE